MTAAALAALLRRHRFAFANEAELQQGIARVLGDAGVLFAREVRLSGRDRIDFVVEGGLGVEVKIDGSLSALTRQVCRYVESEALGAVCVVTSRLALTRLPSVLGGKPVDVVVVGGGIG